MAVGIHWSNVLFIYFVQSNITVLHLDLNPRVSWSRLRPILVYYINNQRTDTENNIYLFIKVAYTMKKKMLLFFLLSIFSLFCTVIITTTECTCLFLLNFVPIGPKFTQHFIRLLSRWLKVTKKVTKSLKKIMKKMWCLQHVVFPSGHPSKY